MRARNFLKVVDESVVKLDVQFSRIQLS